MRIELLLMAGLASLVVACSEPEPADHSVIGEPLQQALDRASGVEDLMQEEAAELRRRIEEDEGR
jgi:hypothetical protein